MKKALSKLPFVGKKTEAPAGRITTDTIAEHREQVLAGGRRFKYPVQYARHKLVINAVLIAIVALLTLGVLGWWQLYPVQNTSDFIYRVTKVLPLQVAKVDGEPVQYSDYLMRYRSSVQYLVERDQINLNTEDGKQQADYVKRRELDGAIADAYAAKLARENNISVTDSELEAFLIQQRTSTDGDVSEATYNAVILDYYGWTPDEYRHAMMNKLLRQKVSFEIDAAAKTRVTTIEAFLKGGETSLGLIADRLNTESPGALTYSAPIWVPRDNRDGGLAEAAAKLEKGKISNSLRLVGGNGYYFVKLVDSNDSQLQYEFVLVTLQEFTGKLQQVKTDGRIVEYITIAEVAGE